MNYDELKVGNLVTFGIGTDGEKKRWLVSDKHEGHGVFTMKLLDDHWIEFPAAAAESLELVTARPPWVKGKLIRQSVEGALGYLLTSPSHGAAEAIGCLRQALVDLKE